MLQTCSYSEHATKQLPYDYRLAILPILNRVQAKPRMPNAAPWSRGEKTWSKTVYRTNVSLNRNGFGFQLHL